MNWLQTARVGKQTSRYCQQTPLVGKQTSPVGKQTPRNYRHASRHYQHTARVPCFLDRHLNEIGTVALRNPNAAGATGRVTRPVKYGKDNGKPWRRHYFTGRGARCWAMTEIRLVALKSHESGCRRTETLFLNSFWVGRRDDSMGTVGLTEKSMWIMLENGFKVKLWKKSHRTVQLENVLNSIREHSQHRLFWSVAGVIREI